MPCHEVHFGRYQSLLNANIDDKDIYNQIDGIWFEVMIDYVIRKNSTWKEMQYFPLLRKTTKTEKGIRWVLTPKFPEMEAYPEHFQMYQHKGEFMWVKNMTIDPTEQQLE
ncbi:hypothetical protein AX16_010947 [Volvariella volvacea WC 439]|nr:hypothetical protein AX16_010947 [Volvariella volvacea WC 439]